MYEISFNNISWDDFSGGVDLNPRIFDDYVFSPKAIDNFTDFTIDRDYAESYVYELGQDYCYLNSSRPLPETNTTDYTHTTIAHSLADFSASVAPSTPPLASNLTNPHPDCTEENDNLLSPSGPRSLNAAFSSALDSYLSNLATMHSNDFRFDSLSENSTGIQQLDQIDNFEFNEPKSPNLTDASILKLFEPRQGTTVSYQKNANRTCPLDTYNKANQFQDSVADTVSLDSSYTTKLNHWTPSAKENTNSNSVSEYVCADLESVANRDISSGVCSSLAEISPLSAFSSSVSSSSSSSSSSSFSSPCSVKSQRHFSPLSSVSEFSSPASLSTSPPASTGNKPFVKPEVKPLSSNYPLPSPPMLCKQNESRLSLPNLYILMGLATNHKEAAFREKKILGMLESRGFKLGEQTWIRDTTETFRKDILDWIYNDTFADFGYDKDLIEIIIKRNCYYVMQGKLRKIRRGKRRRDSIILKNSLSYV
ncbi:hypothetical protein NADFUDRAFT_82772 [Nadsonia fulvescens var. elongata DSM 6958]|uniref:Uncharacterized protein n=1 Tax=Nadsonia fulvescens var. elongata DSM 6958 TaxID=857566 RepID=A0A1E3PK47_9ASCO|nr:hypothetical protein NADFUDRAFT_82772 [Nadsonia fulvescens var. elongata DSM 6958]